MQVKTYPNTIRLKKSLMAVVVAAVVIIAALILYNLYHAAYIQTVRVDTNENTPVRTVASGADTHWYQQQTTIPKKAITTAVTNPAPSTGKPERVITPTPTPYAPRPLTADELKAMAAPISLNQLTAQNAMTNDASNTEGTDTAPTTQDTQTEKNAFMQNNAAASNDYLGTTVTNPISPYELQAGAIIPGILITGINSDLPGQIVGQVRSNVYDTISGNTVLIPQGAKLTGLYDSQVAYGQARVLVVWQRILFPNGQSMDLAGMPGVDLSGYAGFYDQVNNHYGKIFGSAILMSILSAGAQLAQPQTSNNPFAAPTVGQTLAQSLGTTLANTGTMITTKNLNIQPTLQIRPGYEFNIMVTKDMVFPGPYGAAS